MEQGKPEILTTLTTISRYSGKEMQLYDVTRERDLHVVCIILRSYGDQGRITA